MPGLYSHTTRANGTTLTAAIYNADHENHITNEIPTMMDDYSTNAAEMQTTSDPGEIGTESLATTLAGELERLRYAILEAKQALNNNITQWYQSPKQVADDLLRLPPWYIEGLDFRIGPTKCGMVQVATGWCRDSSDTINMRVSTPIAKGITALWASQVATGAGGQGVTFAAIKAQHHVFVIKTAASTFDVGFDSSVGATNLMARASGTYYRRIGTIFAATAGGTTTPALQVVCRRGRHKYYGTDFYGEATYFATFTVVTTNQTVHLPLTPTGIPALVEANIGFDVLTCTSVVFYAVRPGDTPTTADQNGGGWTLVPANRSGYVWHLVETNASDGDFWIHGADAAGNSFASVPMNGTVYAWTDYRRGTTG